MIRIYCQIFSRAELSDELSFLPIWRKSTLNRYNQTKVKLAEKNMKKQPKHVKGAKINLKLTKQRRDQNQWKPCKRKSGSEGRGVLKKRNWLEFSRRELDWRWDQFRNYNTFIIFLVVFAYLIPISTMWVLILSYYIIIINIIIVTIIIIINIIIIIIIIIITQIHIIWSPSQPCEYLTRR